MTKKNNENPKDISLSEKLWKKANGSILDRLKVAFAMLAIGIIVLIIESISTNPN